MKKYFVISLLSLFSSFAQASTVYDFQEARKEVGAFVAPFGNDMGLRYGVDYAKTDVGTVGVELEIGTANIGGSVLDPRGITTLGATLRSTPVLLAEGWEVDYTFKGGVMSGNNKGFTAPLVQIGPSFKYRPLDIAISMRGQVGANEAGGANSAVLSGLSHYFW